MTKLELEKISLRVDEISERLDWLDPSNSFEANEIESLICELDFYCSTLEAPQNVVPFRRIA